MAYIRLQEHTTLINVNCFETKAVTSGEGEELGQIDSVMIDKEGGNVVFALVSLAEPDHAVDRHYPLPWSMLIPDAKHTSYTVNLKRKKLLRGPAFEQGEHACLNEPSFLRSVYRHYGAAPEAP